MNYELWLLITKPILVAAQHNSTIRIGSYVNNITNQFVKFLKHLVYPWMDKSICNNDG